MPHRHLALLLAATLTVPALTTGGEPRSISVAAAASMKPDFEAITNGAPFDLFLSADAEHPARIAIANPQVAPYGRAVQPAMEKAGIFGAVKDRIVMGQNVNQAVQFAQSEVRRPHSFPFPLPRSRHSRSRRPSSSRERGSRPWPSK